MCGIVGYAGRQQALPILLTGLRRLEYRGYDSAGVAVLDEGEVQVVRKAGKLEALEQALGSDGALSGLSGIGHTRWATHGQPTDRNAHPHLDCSGKVAVIHNGIIENFYGLRGQLEAEGHRFASQTDTECVAHLVEAGLREGLPFPDAVRSALKRLEGSFALAVKQTLEGRYDADHKLTLDELRMSEDELREVDKVFVVACGTAYHAGLVAKYAIEHWTRLPVEIEMASEFRYRDPVLDRNTLVIAISQSGETADTSAAVRYARRQRARVLSVCNTVGASIPRESDGVLYTRAGPEIGVAATKTFATQLIAMYLLALYLAQVRGTMFPDEAVAVVDELSQMPEKIQLCIDRLEDYRKVALKFAHNDSFLFLGRHVGYPMALEGALKLKEIGYIHAEGYPAGELKHGPIALIEEGTPVVVVNPHTHVYAKTVTNMQEVASRGAAVIAIAEDGDLEVDRHASDVMRVPPTTQLLSPLTTLVPLQALSYFVAVARGAPVDKPRNLAKSVTVE